MVTVRVYSKLKKKTEGENRLFLQEKKKRSGRILDLRAFLIKQLLHSRLLDMR